MEPRPPESSVLPLGHNTVITTESPRTGWAWRLNSPNAPARGSVQLRMEACTLLLPQRGSGPYWNAGLQSPGLPGWYLSLVVSTHTQCTEIQNLSANVLHGIHFYYSLRTGLKTILKSLQYTQALCFAHMLSFGRVIKGLIIFPSHSHGQGNAGMCRIGPFPAAHWKQDTVAKVLSNPQPGQVKLPSVGKAKDFPVLLPRVKQNQRQQPWEC